MGHDGINSDHVVEHVTAQVAEEDREQFVVLRQLLPELHALPDGTLYTLYDSYQRESNHSCEFSPWRDDDFVFYVLGRAAGLDGDDYLIEYVGRIVAYGLLRGNSMSQSALFAKACASYDRALGHLARRIAKAVRYISSKPDVRFGPAVRTTTDAFRMARTFRISTFLCEQEFADFTN